MAKNLTGYVRFDKKRKRWFFRCSPVDPKTGLRKERKEFFLTQKEAEQARRKFLTEFERNGDAVFSREDLTFEQLAKRYQEARMIPAELNFVLANGWIERNPFTATTNGKSLIRRAMTSLIGRLGSSFPLLLDEAQVLDPPRIESETSRPLLIVAGEDEQLPHASREYCEEAPPARPDGECVQQRRNSLSGAGSRVPGQSGGFRNRGENLTALAGARRLPPAAETAPNWHRSRTR